MRRAPANNQVLKLLEQILQAEMAGMIRYLHYSFMVMGHNRIPIQKWLRDLAAESMDHAVLIGEKITSLGGHPTMMAPPIDETNVHSIDQLLKESLVHEEQGLALYRRLVGLAGDDLALEEMAREFVRRETEHIDEVRKMLRAS
jgi:bacterioferritin